MELVVGNRILFLDEPTTGLDVCSALSMIKLLKKYVSMCVLSQYSYNELYNMHLEQVKRTG